MADEAEVKEDDFPKKRKKEKKDPFSLGEQVRLKKSESGYKKQFVVVGYLENGVALLLTDGSNGSLVQFIIDPDLLESCTPKEEE